MTDILKKLSLILEDRKTKSSGESYVSSLYVRGLDHTCKKIEEESIELIDALKNESNERIISEAADLWFHSLVSLSMKNLSSFYLFWLEHLILELISGPLNSLRKIFPCENKNIFQKSFPGVRRCVCNFWIVGIHRQP